MIKSQQNSKIYTFEARFIKSQSRVNVVRCKIQHSGTKCQLWYGQIDLLKSQKFMFYYYIYII